MKLETDPKSKNFNINTSSQINRYSQLCLKPSHNIHKFVWLPDISLQSKLMAILSAKTEQAFRSNPRGLCQKTI